jgi:hypothetical protein
MNEQLLIAVVVFAAAFGLLLFVVRFAKRRPKTLDTAYFTQQWQDAQRLCKDKDTWPLAVINADKLLDEALKKSRYRGKSMGERLVAAQRELSDNDSVWFGHKLRNRLVHESNVKLQERDVRDALFGIRQALRDLGALKK